MLTTYLKRIATTYIAGAASTTALTYGLISTDSASTLNLIFLMAFLVASIAALVNYESLVQIKKIQSTKGQPLTPVTLLQVASIFLMLFFIFGMLIMIPLPYDTLHKLAGGAFGFFTFIGLPAYLILNVIGSTKIAGLLRNSSFIFGGSVITLVAMLLSVIVIAANQSRIIVWGSAAIVVVGLLISALGWWRASENN